MGFFSDKKEVDDKSSVDVKDEKPKTEVKEESGTDQMDTDVKDNLGIKEEVKDEPMETDSKKDIKIETKEEPMDTVVESEVEVKTESENIGENQVSECSKDTMDCGDSVETKSEPMKVDEVDVAKEESDVEMSEIKVEDLGDGDKVSKKRKMVMVRLAQGNLINVQAYSLLTKKCDVDLMDVSKAIAEHSYYPKVTKPYSRLDNLLERRLKLEDIEKRQRDSILQQLQWKLKLEAAKKEEKEESEKEIISLSRPSAEETEETKKDKPVKQCCYSALCKNEDEAGGSCYSVMCRAEAENEDDDEELDVDDTGNVHMEVDDDERSEGDNGKKESADKSESAEKSGTEDEEIDIIGDKDDEKSNKTAAENLNSNNGSKVTDTVKANNTPKVVHVPLKKDGATKTAGGSVKSGATAQKGKTLISIPANLAQLIAQKTGQNLTYSQAQAFIKQALEKMSVDDIKAKIPKKKTTQEKVQLLKITKGGVKKKGQKKTSLPVTQKFITPSGIKNLFVLEKWEAKKLSRRAGKIEIHSFKYDCKMNNVNWLYPCPRPLFKTAFKYRLQTIRSLAAAALHLRMFWACLRWDDMANKPPAGGTNTISTETEITTTELLKRRDIGPYGLRSEYLVRKIIVPLGVPEQPKGNLHISKVNTYYSFL